MQQNLSIVLSVDADTGAVSAVQNSFDGLDDSVEQTNTNLGFTRGKLMALAAGAAVLYGLKNAFDFVVQSGWEYNASMDASTSKLTAMVSASRGYITVSGRQVSTMERQKLVAQEVTTMMGILQKTNAQTAMGMSELIDIYSLAKPGMDRYKWALEDQIEIVKLTSNTASTFGMTADELSSGIDDLAAGIWEASSEFGKMMKAVGVSKEEFKAAGDKVAYLKDKLKETGEASDTMDVATSNLSVAWSTLTGRITQPIFDSAKTGINDLSGLLSGMGPDSMQIFADALVDMVNIGVKSMGFLAKVINQVVSSMQIAYAGYQKYAGLVMGGDIAEVKAEIAELENYKKTATDGWFIKKKGNTDVNREIRSLKKKIKSYQEWNDVRRAGDTAHEEVLKRTEALNKMIDTGVKKMTINRSAVTTETEKNTTSTEKLISATGKLDDATGKNKKTGDKNTQSLKDQTSASKALAKEYMTLTGDESGLFELDVSDTFEKFLSSGEYSMEQLSKLYDGMWDKYKNKGKDASKEIASTLSEKMQESFETMQSNFMDIAGNLASAFRRGGIEGLGQTLGGMVLNAANTLIPGLGIAFDVLGTLMSSTVSQEEIDVASGVNTFDAAPIAESISVLETYLKPQMLSASASLAHLKSMDSKFGAIAISLSDASGYNYSGADHVDTASSNLWGGSSTELMTAGLNFQAQSVGSFVDGLVDVDGFELVLSKKSSWFGMVNKEKLIEKAMNVPDDIMQDFSEALSAGIEVIMESANILNLDTDAIKEQLENATIDLGKLNFKDLDAQEQQQLLSDAFGNALNSTAESAFDAVLDPKNASALKDAQRANETYIETLLRTAATHEYASTELALMGQSLGDFTTSLAMADGAGGLAELQAGIEGYQANFYTQEQQSSMAISRLNTQFEALNISMPTSTVGFRDMVEGIDTTTVAGAKLYGQMMGIQGAFYSAVSAIENTIAKLENTIAKLRDAREGYMPTAPLSKENIYANIDNYSTVGTDTIVGQIDKWAQAEIATQTAAAQNEAALANAAEQARVSAHNARIAGLNAEISAANALRQTIIAVKKQTQDLLRSYTVNTTVSASTSLDQAINNKDYDGIQGAYQTLVAQAQNSSKNESEFMRTIASGNAKVQDIAVPPERALLQTITASTQNITANTQEIADNVNAAAAKMIDALILENEGELDGLWKEKKETSDVTIGIKESIDTSAVLTQNLFDEEKINQEINFFGLKEETKTLFGSLNMNQEGHFDGLKNEMVNLRKENEELKEIMKEQKEIMYEQLKLDKNKALTDESLVRSA